MEKGTYAICGILYAGSASIVSNALGQRVTRAQEKATCRKLLIAQVNMLRHISVITVLGIRTKAESGNKHNKRSLL